MDINGNMFVEAYILTWNESETIHLTVKHYKQFCDRIIIYDNFSTDNTREICEALGCEIRTFGIAGVLDDKEYLKVKNHCWKDSKADWVMVVDADEIIAPYNSRDDMKYVLSRNTGLSVLGSFGWNVFSNDVPCETWLEIQTGIHDKNYSKMVCFEPHDVKEMNYVYGCHEANPKRNNGGQCIVNNAMVLFHYKHVGGAQRVANRHAAYAERRSDFNKKWKLGFQYDEPREQTIKYFNECLKKSVPFSPDGFFS